jgi:hypothetical protein
VDVDLRRALAIDLHRPSAGIFLQRCIRQLLFVTPSARAPISLERRQSVLLARIFCGLDLIIPALRGRS